VCLEAPLWAEEFAGHSGKWRTWSCGHYPKSALPWFHLVQAFITVMSAASVITLHQKLLAVHWRPLFINLLTLLVFSEMSYVTLSFCTLQEKRISHTHTHTHTYIYLYMCPAVHMQVWTHDPCFIWLSPNRCKGGVWPSKRYTKSRIMKAPIDHPYRLCWCSERCPMEFFHSVLYRTKESYIYVLLFTCKLEPMTRALFDQVQRDLRVVFEGLVWDTTHWQPQSL
jgi:hypothetical protein